MSTSPARSMRNKVDMVRIADTQNEIIKMQSDIIDNLYQQLCQLLPTKALDTLPLYSMQRAADLRKEVEDT